MFESIKKLVEAARVKGFVGPYYRGVRGKVRMLREKWLVRHDVVSVATSESVKSVVPPKELELRLKSVDNAADMLDMSDEFDAEYYRGYLDQWTELFDRGQTLIVGRIDGKVVSFYWIQRGSWEDVITTYYGVLHGDEAQILRGGVVPSWRRQGVYTRFSYLLVKRLMEAGVRRVYVECTLRNIPSLKAIVRSGFRPVGVLTVIGGALGRPFVRWESAEEVVKKL